MQAQPKDCRQRVTWHSTRERRRTEAITEVEMGYDVSFHPVDVEFFQDQVLPILLGKAPIDTLLAKGIQISKNRYRANAWGLAVNKVHSARFEDLRPPKPTLVDRLLGRPPRRPELPPPPFEFESDLYIWGRPFFITDNDPVSVSESIDAYLSADDAGVDTLAKRMVERIQPGLSSKLTSLDEEPFPADAEFREALSAPLRVLRDAFSNLPTHTQVTLPNGGAAEPDDLIRSDLPLVAFSFACHFRPGWMARGHVWPTHLLRQASIPVERFISASELFLPVMQAHPSLQLQFHSSIRENYMLGGYLPPEAVAAVLATFEDNLEALVRPSIAEGWEYECRLAIRKITEALRDATARGFGFLEASEVYSGPLGLLN
jgi:hypothetical protein